MDLTVQAHAEHGRLEQMLSQFLSKSLHVILDSRVPLASIEQPNRGLIRNSDRWFNLALGDRPASIDSSRFRNRNLTEPTVIDIVLVRESGTKMLLNETVLERWIVRFEHQISTTPPPRVVDASSKTAYKKSIVLLRSVHSMLRLLPAHKAFRKLCSLKQNCDFGINYKIRSFSKPLSRTEEELMKKYSFLPVEVHRGRLSVSLSYRKDLSEFKLDSLVSCPPEIIGDYVGSPLTDPMRAFPSSLYERDRVNSFLVKGKRSNSSRPHSWTSGLHNELSLQQNQLYNGSPPSYKLPYEYSVSTQGQRSTAYQKGNLLSPPFSSSPSPSPPATNLVQTRLRSETAPMSIPRSLMGQSPRFQSCNLSDPNRNSLPPQSPRNNRYGPSSRESSSGSRSMRRHDSLRSRESSPWPISPSQKMSKEDSGRFSSLLSSNSSSRLSFQDDLGDSDFFGPFIVDDVDTPEIQITSLNPGALLHMLRTAPPLRQYTSKAELSGESGAASVFLKSMKTADALEELKAYKQLKDILLSKSTALMVVKGNVEN